MTDFEVPGREQPEEGPTLSELLADEVRPEEDAAGKLDTSIDQLEADKLPNKIAELLTAITFAEPVREEVDWVIADGALLPVTSRARLLAGVDRGLRVRTAAEKVQETPEAPFTDVPEEFKQPAAELQDILDRVATRQVTASNFVSSRIVELAQRATIDPAWAFAACRRSIRSAQGISSSLKERAGILGGHAEDEWENVLRELRRLLFSTEE
jgi:hypothetical protein